MDVSSTREAPHASKAATDPAGPTGRLATWLAATTLEDVPLPVREHAKHLVLDGVACGLVGAQMNVTYAVAVALLDGAVLIDQFAEDRINSDDVWDLIDRTRTHHQKAYDALPLQDRLTTRVALTLKDGSTREKTVAHPPGTGDRLLTDADIVAKYRSLTHSLIDADRQEAIEKAVLNLEALDDISTLTALLIPVVRPALG